MIPPPPKTDAPNPDNPACAVIFTAPPKGASVNNPTLPCAFIFTADVGVRALGCAEFAFNEIKVPAPSFAVKLTTAEPPTSAKRSIVTVIAFEVFILRLFCGFIFITLPLILDALSIFWKLKLFAPLVTKPVLKFGRVPLNVAPWLKVGAFEKVALFMFALEATFR